VTPFPRGPKSSTVKLKDLSIMSVLSFLYSTLSHLSAYAPDFPDTLPAHTLLFRLDHTNEGIERVNSADQTPSTSLLRSRHLLVVDDLCTKLLSLL